MKPNKAMRVGKTTGAIGFRKDGAPVLTMFKFSTIYKTLPKQAKKWVPRGALNH